MRKCIVYINNIEAGILSEEDNPREYVFKYNNSYLAKKLPPISLTMPLRQEGYRSKTLFPYFFNLLSEGENRSMQSSLLHIDKTDDFGILLATARYDTVGAVTIKPITE